MFARPTMASFKQIRLALRGAAWFIAFASFVPSLAPGICTCCVGKQSCCAACLCYCSTFCHCILPQADAGHCLQMINSGCRCPHAPCPTCSCAKETQVAYTRAGDRAGGQDFCPVPAAQYFVQQILPPLTEDARHSPQWSAAAISLAFDASICRLTI